MLAFLSRTLSFASTGQTNTPTWSGVRRFQTGLLTTQELRRRITMHRMQDIRKFPGRCSSVVMLSLPFRYQPSMAPRNPVFWGLDTTVMTMLGLEGWSNEGTCLGGGFAR